MAKLDSKPMPEGLQLEAHLLQNGIFMSRGKVIRTGTQVIFVPLVPRWRPGIFAPPVTIKLADTGEEYKVLSYPDKKPTLHKGQWSFELI